MHSFHQFKKIKFKIKRFQDAFLNHLKAQKYCHIIFFPQTKMTKTTTQLKIFIKFN